ncbi:flavin reductase family protein [Mesobacterium pallidum]|uniref:flavin reductase family protein n=1 Tax=Mesobacterium pallidum TaxID=2872037 RepID=UPI001EE1F17F|nr:flavin reductase family protein [Mesobacterium pallidum]
MAQDHPAAIDFVPGHETLTDFRQALGRFATGVTVVTCTSDMGPLGITANSFSSLSLDPPLVLWSPARSSRRFGAFCAARHFSVHVIGAEQEAIARHFSKQGHDFTGLNWVAGETGVPHLAGCIARFDCDKEAEYEGGDHAIIVGRVRRVVSRPGAPLVFHAGQFLDLDGD